MLRVDVHSTRGLPFTVDIDSSSRSKPRVRRHLARGMFATNETFDAIILKARARGSILVAHFTEQWWRGFKTAFSEAREYVHILAR